MWMVRWERNAIKKMFLAQNTIHLVENNRIRGEIAHSKPTDHTRM
jgi:hypothetical protein